MRFSVLLVLSAAVGLQAADTMPPAPEQKLAVEIYQAMVESKSGFTTGATTPIAESVAARFRAATARGRCRTTRSIGWLRRCRSFSGYQFEFRLTELTRPYFEKSAKTETGALAADMVKVAQGDRAAMERVAKASAPLNDSAAGQAVNVDSLCSFGNREKGGLERVDIHM